MPFTSRHKVYIVSVDKPFRSTGLTGLCGVEDFLRNTKLVLTSYKVCWLQQHNWETSLNKRCFDAGRVESGTILHIQSGLKEVRVYLSPGMLYYVMYMLRPISVDHVLRALLSLRLTLRPDSPLQSTHSGIKGGCTELQTYILY